MTRALPRITSEAALRALEREGWFVSRQSGSHAILRHAEKPGRVVVPRHGGGKTLRPGTLSVTIKSAGLTVAEPWELL